MTGRAEGDLGVRIEIDQLHEEAVEAACDLDRAYFADHPTEDRYTRRPIDHELCPPGLRCIPVDDVLIRVVELWPGLRALMQIEAGARA